MQWRGRRESSNIEDRRGASGIAVGGGIGAVIIGLIVFLLGGDPSQIPQGNSGGATRTGQQVDPAQDSLGHFVSVVLAETEDVWTKIFREQGDQYRDPTLVMFSQRVQSACGIAGSATGPFYCPEDEKVYIDLSFYQTLRDKLGAGGDFAEAYVIAHEVGHHVQKLLGIMNQVSSAQQRGRVQSGANSLSVRLELQADFFAGVWAHYAKQAGILDPGDIEEALNAASSIGDDRLQSASQGYVSPDSFTHGTSAQRVRWFRKGFETGDIKQGNTFETENL